MFNLKQLLDDHANLLDEYTYARVNLMSVLVTKKQTLSEKNLQNNMDVRELQLIPVKEEEEFEGGDITFESVDQIVVTQLDTIESNHS